jgi:hypothetical protein
MSHLKREAEGSVDFDFVTLEEVHRTFPWGRGAGGVSAFPLLTGHQHTAMVRAAQGAWATEQRKLRDADCGPVEH